MWTFFVLCFFAALIIINYKKVCVFAKDPQSWWRNWILSVTCKGKGNWTTFYFKTNNATHVHLVPEDKHDHVTDWDGDCMCHTQKEEYDEKVIYRHQRLGV